MGIDAQDAQVLKLYKLMMSASRAFLLNIGPQKSEHEDLVTFY